MKNTSNLLIFKSEVNGEMEISLSTTHGHYRVVRTFGAIPDRCWCGVIKGDDLLFEILTIECRRGIPSDADLIAAAMVWEAYDFANNPDSELPELCKL